MGLLGMFSRPLGIPLVYAGDALAGGGQIKGTLENGWYERNPLLGAPFGQNYHDFPTADNLQFVLARVLGLFTDQWAVAYNLIFLATFPAAALAAAWFVRAVGGSRLVAFGVGILYAFTPYHFVRGQAHLSLSMYFVVPLFAGLLMKVLADRPVWARRAGSSTRNVLAWVTPTSLGTLVVVGLLGTTSSYYSVFGLLLASVVLAVTLLQRRWSAAIGLVAAMAALVAVMVINMAPDILYARSVPPSPSGFARHTVDSELYALKFTQLLLPTPWHPLGALADFRNSYDDTFPNPAEYPALGIVGAIGFVFLLALPLVLILRRAAVPEHGPFDRTQQHLALLTWVAFLLGTTGGLGTMFALVVSPDIRAWNRIAIYIALFGLTAIALLIDQLLRRIRANPALRRPRGRRLWSDTPLIRRPGEVFAVTLVVVLVGVGVWDEAAPPSGNAPDAAVDDWRNDEAYVHAVEDAVRPGTKVFEMPYLSFPEADPSQTSDMQPYDPMRPYLHSSTLAWSYGGLQGRPRADWPAALSDWVPRRLAVALAASGFGGIHIDRFGYPHHDPGKLERVLRALVGPPIESPDDRYAFYDLAPLREDVEKVYSAEEIATIARHTLRHPVLYSQPGFTGPPTRDANGDLYLDGASEHPEAILDNPGAPLRLRLDFKLHAEADSYPTPVTITWPDGSTETRSVGPEGTRVSRTFSAPSGQHKLAFDGPEATQVYLRQWVLRDPGLAFPLRGLAATLHDDQ
jgi:phosphoglycerol transferase